MPEKTSLQDFLQAINGQNEAGLIIARDESELSGFVCELTDAGFQKLNSVLEYANADHGWYFQIGAQQEFKIIYDFICQYPLATVSLYDAQKSAMAVLQIEYTYPIVFVFTKDTCVEIQKAGFDLIGRGGPAFQSE